MTGSAGRNDPLGRPSIAASVDGVLCDGREATIPLYDDGLLRGDGAFEFVRCYAGQPFALGEHLARLARTCTTIRLRYPGQRLEAEILALLAQARPCIADMRVVLTRGGRRIVLLEQSDLNLPPARLAFIIDSPRAVLAGTKTLSYAGNMLAKRLAEERGYRDALLTTPDGRLMEVQQAAFFWVTPQGDLCTPPLSEGILDSITRRVVTRNMDVDERVCREADALAASEAFLASTAREIQAVGVIEGRVFDDPPGPVTRQTVASFRRVVAQQLGVAPAEIWVGR